MRILLGVGGGIAAYKACELASRLVQAGHTVDVIMTAAARQFVAPLTFEALTHRPVSTAVGDQPAGPLSHVRLARDADLLLVAPATADLLARFATGRADDMLTAVYLGVRCPVWVAPAMEPEMWAHPATQRHAAQLAGDGVRILGPARGRMASGDVGVGRLVEPAEIARAVEGLGGPQDLVGWRVLVTAGPTWEFFDPVRLLTNPSTGAMGAAVSEAARNRGATVTLVHGPLRVVAPEGMETVSVVSAAEMYEAVMDRFQDAEVVVATAAVSDYRPARRLSEKATKDTLSEPAAWRMVANPDILEELGHRKTGQTLVGFKAQTQDHVGYARRMLEQKRLDLVVANRVEEGRGFGQGASEAWLVRPGREPEAVTGSKRDLAHRLWDVVREIRGR
jgi:phosphopantothenoylcysteine decarboxylase/phosphopantothenate--cysteine ligase